MVLPDTIGLDCILKKVMTATAPNPQPLFRHGSGPQFLKITFGGIVPLIYRDVLYKPTRALASVYKGNPFIMVHIMQKWYMDLSISIGTVHQGFDRYRSKSKNIRTANTFTFKINRLPLIPARLEPFQLHFCMRWQIFLGNKHYPWISRSSFVKLHYSRFRLARRIRLAQRVS